MKTRQVIAILLGITASQEGGWAVDFDSIPSRAPDDAVMADAAEVKDMLDWVNSSFLGRSPSDTRGAVALEARRQDFNVLRFGRSCMETPIRIGQQEFAHGLGTHANSEIAVRLPPAAVRLTAVVGIDNNYDTQGTHGSVVFSVQADGREVARTPVLHGGDEPYALAVDVPDGTAVLVLKVDTTPDGPGHDQADWADARLTLRDGTEVWLDDGQLDRLLSHTCPPLSFVYGGTPSDDLLKTWPCRSETREDEHVVEHTVRWDAPDASLSVVATVRAFRRYPAVDWVLSFENGSDSDSLLLENIQPLDVQLRTGNSKNAAIVRSNRGDVCGADSFAANETALQGGAQVRMAPEGGRSSNGAFPFFDILYGDECLTAAVGWSGQWAASVERLPTGPSRLRAGMEQTHLVLHAGESIRSPRILLCLNRSDLDTAHNRFRRLLLFHYVPQEAGKPVRMPVVLQCFDRYSWSRAEWATEAGQLAAVQSARELGFDTYWLDAAWFEGGFPNGVGNWYPKPVAFPNGLGPIGEACHAAGMRFVLWFEPERVAKGSRIAREHPEFVFGGEEGGLFRLNEPEARRWLTELLSGLISDSGIDVYRNDFNIDPLGFWRAHDAPDRQGMTEIRYVEGLYTMWDELRARHPGLLIDNCASGGRRIDLETCMRSVPLWRSDTNCSPGHADWNQAHSLRLSPYLPFHTACAWTPDIYEVRSALTAGLICQWDYLGDAFPREEAQAGLKEAIEIQPYWYGDFYPLTSGSSAPQEWSAYQLHRPDKDAGVVLAFRRKDSNYTGLAGPLRGITTDKTYRVTFVPEDRRRTEQTLTGRELTEGLELRLPQKGSSLVVFYEEDTE